MSKKHVQIPAHSSPTPESPRERGPGLLHVNAVLILLVITCLAYANAYRSGWVLDNRFIIQNDPRNKAVTWDNLRDIWTHDYWWPKATSGLYRPMTTLSYLFDWSVQGFGSYKQEAEQVVGFHRMNLLFHWFNGCLLYAICLRMLKHYWMAFFAAAIFIAHPITSESVTNLVGRADQFAAMCVLAGLLVYILYTETAARPHGTRPEGLLSRLPAWVYLVLLSVITALGLFSKESAAAVGLVIPLYDLVFTLPPFDAGWKLRARRAFSRYLVMVPPLLLMLWARSNMLAASNPAEWPFIDNPLHGPATRDILGAIEARLVAVKVMGKYFYRLLWPVPLCCDYSYNQIAPFTWNPLSWENWKCIFCLGGLVAGLRATVRAARTQPVVSFFVGLSLLTFLPTSNLLFTVGTIMAERFMYLPLVGFSVCLVVAVKALCERVPITSFGAAARGVTRDRWPHAVLTVIILLYCVRTHSRNKDWETEESLWTAALELSPNSFHPYQALALALYEHNPKGNLDRSISVAEKGIAVLDGLPDEKNATRLYTHVGLYYGAKGDTLTATDPTGKKTQTPGSLLWYQKATTVLERAVPIDRAFNRYYKQGFLKRGTDPALVPDCGMGTLYTLLGSSYSRLGYSDKALEAYRYARHLDASNPDGYLKIASVHLSWDQWGNAVVPLLQALILDGKNQEAWQALKKTYDHLNNTGSPCVVVNNKTPQLVVTNPLVRQHLVKVYQGFIKIYLHAGRLDEAMVARRAAVQVYKLEPKDFDGIFATPGAAPHPPTPIFFSPETWVTPTGL